MAARQDRGRKRGVFLGFWHKVLLAPIAGILLFISLYIMAALEYPGGSYKDPTISGFSFWHNYLCDLLDERAINGSLNPGSLYARIGLGVLCTSTAYMWYIIPGLFPPDKWFTRLMRFGGMLAMGALLFLRPGSHDVVVRIAGVLGVMALISCLFQLYRFKYLRLFALGTLSFLIFLLNYYVYETRWAIQILPVLQKITFFLFLLWFVWLDIVLYKENRRRSARHE